MSMEDKFVMCCTVEFPNPTITHIASEQWHSHSTEILLLCCYVRVVATACAPYGCCCYFYNISVTLQVLLSLCAKVTVLCVKAAVTE